LLTLFQECQKNNLAVREFQSVMVDRALAGIDLPKDCGLVINSRSPWPHGCSPYFLGKGQLRPRH
jgi:hypothetical protein